MRQLGCSYAQGFLLARPAPFESCRRYLTGLPLDLTTYEHHLAEILEATGS